MTTPTGFQYNGLDLASILAPNIAGAIMTNYTTNSNTIKFLQQFYTNTDVTSYMPPPYSLTPNYPYAYKTNSFLFCPAYIFYGNSQNADSSGSVLTPVTATVNLPDKVKKMFAVVVGGGGGGGGGGAKSGGGSSGGGGGGGGALMSFMVYYTAGYTSFTYTAGSGGMYGQPSNATNTAPGAGGGSSNTTGKSGSDGTASSFTYAGIINTANFGKGGTGGGTASSTGGTGGAATFQSYMKSGASGAGSTYTGSQNTAGGVGGKPGNLNTTNTSGYLINPGLINMTSSQTQLSNSQNINPPVPLIYGAGGHGGKGDSSSNFGVAGEFGAPGCVIVFFYY